VQQLAFPSYDFRLKSSENKSYIFDPIRKKFVRLHPEEWVRQHTLKYLIETKEYPISLINVEKEIKLKNTRKRYDIVVFNSDGSIFLVIECKSYNIGVTQGAFDQIARYNLELQASFLMVTNGLSHYYCTLDYEQKRYRFLQELPDFNHNHSNHKS